MEMTLNSLRPFLPKVCTGSDYQARYTKLSDQRRQKLDDGVAWRGEFDVNLRRGVIRYASGRALIEGESEAVAFYPLSLLSPLSAPPTGRATG